MKQGQTKKGRLISLSVYRKKKKKLNLGKAKKAASDQNFAFVDHENTLSESSNNREDNKKVEKPNIHYMDNYLKTRRLLTLEENNQEERKLGKNIQGEEPLQSGKKKLGRIIKFSKYKKKSQPSPELSKRKDLFSSEGSNMIDLENYRQNKNLQDQKRRETASLRLFKRAVGGIPSVVALAVMMLFALNTFFSTDGLFNVKGSSYYAENDEEPFAVPSESKRGIASSDFKAQEVIVGKKPESSAYKGF